MPAKRSYGPFCETWTFVVLKRARLTGNEAKAIAKQLRDWVGKEIEAITKPKDIRFGDELPKNDRRPTLP